METTFLVTASFISGHQYLLVCFCRTRFNGLLSTSAILSIFFASAAALEAMLMRVNSAELQVWKDT